MQLQNAEIRVELQQSVRKAKAIEEERQRHLRTYRYGDYELLNDEAIENPEYCLQTNEYQPFECNHSFGCYRCCEQFPPGQVHCSKETWSNLHPTSYWNKIMVKCPSCFKKDKEWDKERQRVWERERELMQAERRAENARQKKKRAVRANIEDQRLEQMVTQSKATKKFTHTLLTLKLPALKRLCKRNGLMNSGKKRQLVYRLTAARLHGTLYACPYCGKKKLELQYAQEQDVKPSGVRCKHMKCQGKQCTFKESFDDDETKAEILKEELRDTKHLDLFSVLNKKITIRKSKK